MKTCKNTRKLEGSFQHQCPYCGAWNDYGVWGVAHDSEDLNYTGCQCGKTYKVPRYGCMRAKEKVKHAKAQTTRRR